MGFGGALVRGTWRKVIRGGGVGEVHYEHFIGHGAGRVQYVLKVGEKESIADSGSLNGEFVPFNDADRRGCTAGRGERWARPLNVHAGVCHVEDGGLPQRNRKE